MDDIGGILGNDDFLESNTFQLDELVNELLKDDELETVKGNDSSSDDGYNGSISPPNSSPSQASYGSQSPASTAGHQPNRSPATTCNLDDILTPDQYTDLNNLDDILVHQNIVQVEPVQSQPQNLVPSSCHPQRGNNISFHSTRRTNGRVNPYNASDARYIRKIERPVKKVTTPKSLVREQKIFSNETCQIVKVEPHEPERNVQNTVVVKTEPPTTSSKQYRVNRISNGTPVQTFKQPTDILHEAWNSVSSGMDHRGRVYKRTPAQMKAEERKIRNRQSASISRERKKQHLEDTEKMNKQLKQENEILKQRNAELMKRISFLELELSKANSWKKDQTKRLGLTGGALLSITVLGLLAMPSMNRFDPIQSSTDLSLPDGTIHHGRKLMSYQEEKALSTAMAADYWLDDVLKDVRNNNGLIQILNLASDGPVDIQRTIRRKLYEEFGIKVGRIPDTRRGKLYRDVYQAVPRGLPDTPSNRRNSVPQPPPRLLNQMCNKVSDGNKLHKVLGDWKMPKDLHQDSREGQEDSIQNETQLIRAGDIWKESDLLNSISYNIKNDSYYIVSLHPLQFIVPPNLNNTKSNTGPKMTLVFPTGDTNLSNEHLDMLQIDCLVTGTKAISLSRIVEQDDDEVRVEIEV